MSSVNAITFDPYLDSERMNKQIQKAVDNIDPNTMVFGNVDYSNAYKGIIDEFEVAKQNDVNNESAQGAGNDGTNGTNGTDGTNGATGGANGETAAGEAGETIATPEQIKALRDEFKNIQDEQGWIGKAWNGVKNFFGSKNGSNKVKETIDKAEAGEISYQEACERLAKYRKGQNTASGVIKGIGTAAAVVAGVALAPVTGGASIAVAAGVGAAANIGLNASDKATNNIEGDYTAKDVLKDGVTGAVSGAVTVATAGVGSAGVVTAETTGKVLVGQTIKQGVVSGAKAGAISGAAMGATDYTMEAATNENVDFTVGGLVSSTAGGAISGAVGGGIAGGVTSGFSAVRANGTYMKNLRKGIDLKGDVKSQVDDLINNKKITSQKELNKLLGSEKKARKALGSDNYDNLVKSKFTQPKNVNKVDGRIQKGSITSKEDINKLYKGEDKAREALGKDYDDLVNKADQKRIENWIDDQKGNLTAKDLNKKLKDEFGSVRKAEKALGSDKLNEMQKKANNQEIDNWMDKRIANNKKVDADKLNKKLTEKYSTLDEAKKAIGDEQFNELQRKANALKAEKFINSKKHMSVKKLNDLFGSKAEAKTALGKEQYEAFVNQIKNGEKASLIKPESETTSAFRENMQNRWDSARESFDNFIDNPIENLRQIPGKAHDGLRNAGDSFEATRNGWDRKITLKDGTTADYKLGEHSYKTNIFGRTIMLERDRAQKQY